MRDASRKQTDILRHITEAGFGSMLMGFGFAHLLSARTRALLQRTDDRLGDSQALARLLTDLGPGFVELARIMAPRSDIIPQKYQNMLFNLTYYPMRRRGVLKGISLRRAFGRAAKDICYIESADTAGTPVAQQYHAVCEDGRRMVVLLHDRRALERLEQNSDQIRWMLDHVLSRIDSAHQLIWGSIWEEFQSRVRSLVDLRIAASDMHTLREQFDGVGKIVVPKVYWQYTNQHAMSFERVMQPCFDDIALDRHAGAVSKKYVARYLFDLFARQYGVTGHFLVRPRSSALQVGKQNKIYLAQPLLIGIVPPEERQRLALCLYALAKGDDKTASKAMLSLSYERQHEDHYKHAGFRPYRHEEGTLSELFWALLERAWSGHLHVPLSCSLVAESLTYLEHAVARIDEEVDVADGMRVAIQKYVPTIFGTAKQATLKTIASAVLNPTVSS